MPSDTGLRIRGRQPRDGLTPFASMTAMRVAMVASECEPFAKTGGLADVVDALSRALGRLGHEVDVYLPRYRGVAVPAEHERRPLAVPVGVASDVDVGDVATVDLLTAQADGYRIRLVEHPHSYDRAGYYGEGGDYPDNAARFALLGRTALEAIRSEGRPVDVLHGHDWQAGPALLLQRRVYGSDPVVGPAASVLTCHNLAYHGWVPRPVAWQLGLPEGTGAPDGVDLLREAIAVADLVNTVSATYAEESRRPEYGAGLDDLLATRGDRYLGILNGIDAALWDPATDAALPARYSRGDLAGKAACKRELEERLGLGWADQDEGWDERGAPLLGMIGRLDPQKGFDLLAAAAGHLIDLGARIVVLGTGDRRLIADLETAAAARRDRLVVLERFDREEARRIYAASDLFLMPSRFEPSGQGQLIALRYGSVPLVRATGGLADTVRDADADPAGGNGFVFDAADAAALVEAARRAIEAYRDRPRWERLVARGMAEDFSWDRPARQYVALYERAVGLRWGGHGAGAAAG